MRLAQITNWLYVSGRESCNYSPVEFDKIIHIWRSDKPDHSCNYQKQFPLGDENNLVIDYQDGKELPDYILESIYDFVKDKKPEDKVLVHCAAGITRGPTIALFALAINDKIHPFGCMNIIYYNLLTHYREIANMCRKPLKDIVRYYELNRNKLD